MSNLETKLKAAIEAENLRLEPFYNAVKQFSDAISSVNRNFYVSAEYSYGEQIVYLRTWDVTLQANVKLFRINPIKFTIIYNGECVHQSSAENLADDMATLFMYLIDIHQYLAWMRVYRDSGEK